MEIGKKGVRGIGKREKGKRVKREQVETELSDIEKGLQRNREPEEKIM